MNRIERAQLAKQKMKEKNSEILTFADVMKILSVTAPTLSKYIRDGEIPGKKIGGRWFIRSEDLRFALDPWSKKRLNSGRARKAATANASS